MNKTQYNHKAYGLSTDDLKRLAPSIFAEAAHESRSSRYAFVPTTLSLTALAEAGFVPTYAQESIARKDDHKGYTKHLLRFRKVQDLGYTPEVFEISFINSHDGGSGLELDAALWRQVCSNGLMRATSGGSFRVRHTGNIVTEVVEETLRIAQTSPEVFNEIERMKATKLTPAERELFAKYALLARFGLHSEEQQEPTIVDSELVSVSAPASPIPQAALTVYQPADFLRPYRYADSGTDLFTTLNVVQENVMKGASHVDARGKRQKSRRINGIDQSKQLNRLLWSMAQEFLTLKNQ